MKEERHEKLLTILREKKEANISMLAKAFGVTEMTIHRDLDKLQSSGYIEKQRGKAIYVKNNSHPSIGYTYSKLSKINLKEKIAISEEASKLIKTGDSIIFDNSSSAYQVVSKIKDLSNITVYATSQNVCNILADKEDIILFSSGGLYSRQTDMYVGSCAQEFFSNIHASKCFISAYGISKNGLTDPFPLEATIKNKIIQACDYTVVVATSDKFNRTSIELVSDFTNIDCIITDCGFDKENLKYIPDSVKVIIANNN